MAQIVCIDTGTLRSGCALGDIVSIHDDKAELTGPGYTGFRILKVPGTVEQVRTELAKKIPERKRCFRLPVANTWTDTPPDEASFWKDGTSWKQIVEEPKFALNIKDLDAAKSKLADSRLTIVEKVAAVSMLTESKVAVNPKNQRIVSIKTAITPKV